MNGEPAQLALNGLAELVAALLRKFSRNSLRAVRLGRAQSSGSESAATSRAESVGCLRLVFRNFASRSPVVSNRLGCDRAGKTWVEQEAEKTLSNKSSGQYRCQSLPSLRRKISTYLNAAESFSIFGSSGGRKGSTGYVGSVGSLGIWKKQAATVKGSWETLGRREKCCSEKRRRRGPIALRKNRK